MIIICNLKMDLTEPQNVELLFMNLIYSQVVLTF